MPTPEERARLILGACTCLPDYTLRGRSDPQCMWCDAWEEAVEQIRAAENDAIERCAAWLYEQTKNGGDLEEISQWGVASIRALKRPAPMEEKSDG